MPDPNFLLIGTQKAGTTWLSKMIGMHPDVHTAVQKEVSFFGNPERYARGIEWYRKQFRGYAGQAAIGEFTPHYLWTNRFDVEEDAETHEAIYRHYPEMKFIVCLRHPVQRAISAYYHHIRARRIAPHSDLLVGRDQYGIIALGRYHTHLSKWFTRFSKDQFLVLTYEEDIQRGKEGTLRSVFQFLGVEASFVPDGIDGIYNQREGHFYMRVNYYWPRLAHALKWRVPWLTRMNRPAIQIDERERFELEQLYTEEVQQLEELLGRQFPWSMESSGVLA